MNRKELRQIIEDTVEEYGGVVLCFSTTGKSHGKARIRNKAGIERNLIYPSSPGDSIHGHHNMRSTLRKILTAGA